MAELIPQVDYTSRDFESIKSDLIAKIPFFTSEWTDTNPTDFGIVLLELFAMVGDSLHFQVDRALNESFLLTAASRRSVVNLLKLIDFELASASPATVVLEFTLGDVQVVDVVIPSGTQVLTEGEPQLTFETNTDLLIAAGDTVGSVAATEGETQNEDVGDSDGRPFQRFNLILNPIIDGTLRIFIDEGPGDVLWTELDTLALAEATDEVYNTQRDDEGNISIFFGDDGQGKIPADASPIRAVARVGGGEQGNVGAGSITILKTPIIVGIDPISVTVTNILPSTGGEDEQTIEEAKVLGPRSLRALDRAVTEEDFETHALSVEGVAKAKAFIENTFQRVVDVFIAPKPSGGLPSQPLKDQVKGFLDVRKMAGTIVEVEDPTFVGIDMTATIQVLNVFVQASVAALVNAAIDDLLDFNNSETDFARELKFSDTVALIDGIDGVDFVDFTKHTIKPVVTKGQFTGDATITEIFTTNTTVKENWIITFTSATTFTVSGSVTGPIGSGTTGSEFTAPGGQIRFTISVGATPMVVDDKFLIRTDNFLTNIFLLQNEINEKGTITFVFSGGS